MQKKLTITIDEQVYDGLHRVIGPRKISQFIEGLVRPHVIAAEPVAITLRYLQTLTEIAAEKNSTIVFPLPIEMLHLLRQITGVEPKGPAAA